MRYKPMKINKLTESELNPGKVLSEKNAAFADMLSTLIIDEWEAINGYQGVIQTMKKEKMSQKAIDILQSIMAEEHAHVGELHKVLTLVNPDSESQIEHGKEEAEEII
jgi:rubrerythrin